VTAAFGTPAEARTTAVRFTFGRPAMTGERMRIEVDARKWRWLPDLTELWTHRDLLATLAMRDIRVRYAQTRLGLLWALVQPLVTLGIMVLVFHRAAKVDTAPVPYVLFAMSGITAWTYFAFVLKESGASLIGAQEMVRKIYFPRLVIPLSKSMVGLMDLLVALLLLGLMFAMHGVMPPGRVLWLPVFLLGILMAGVGVGIWVSALTIRFRDLQHVIPVLVQLGLFITPVAYPAELVTDALPAAGQVAYFLNPMAGLTEGFRWSLLGTGTLGWPCAISVAMSVVLLLTGLVYFRSMERVVADLI
jgi:lipopolysaccharide transport system permease protein